MFSFFRKAKKPTIKPFDFSRNRFPAHSKWPPVFSAMTAKEQFRFERKFRRRMKLKWARPIWNRNLQLVQWGSIIFVIIYGTFFIDWSVVGGGQDEAPGPVMTMRRWADAMANSIWTFGSSEQSREQALQNQEIAAGNDAPRRRSAPQD